MMPPFSLRHREPHPHQPSYIPAPLLCEGEEKHGRGGGPPQRRSHRPRPRSNLPPQGERGPKRRRARMLSHASARRYIPIRPRAANFGAPALLFFLRPQKREGRARAALSSLPERVSLMYQPPTHNTYCSRVHPPPYGRYYPTQTTAHHHRKVGADDAVARPPPAPGCPPATPTHPTTPP